VSGVEDAAVTALAKLDQVLPPRLAERVRAIGAGTVQTPRDDLPRIDPDVLITLAAACRRTEGVRFSYRNHQGRHSERSVEPLRVVHTGRRWYLVALDRDARDWRTFRVDRISAPAPTGHRYTFADPPDPVALVGEATGVAPWRIQARLVLHVDAGTAASRIPPTAGVIEPIDDGRCSLRIAAEELWPLVDMVLRIPWPFEIVEPDSLRDAVRSQAELLRRASAPPLANKST
jgi:predicted DNA-binding transcriptional regulator YafY